MIRKPSLASEGGFALVGVIMFVLVLTILGLSLFGLSSFEAQFMQSSLDRSRCFQAAMGGLERAKWVLTRKAPYLLQEVGLGIPRDSVVYAEARQGSIDWDSAEDEGPVQWDGPPVWIRVTAVVGSRSRSFEARFQPSRPRDMYRNLMSLAANHSQALVVTAFDDRNPAIPRWTQTSLLGDVWMNTGDHSAAPVPLECDPTYTVGGVPAPDLDTYFTRVAGDAQPVPEPTSSDPLRLDGTSWPNGIGLFKTFEQSDDPGFDHWNVRWKTGNPRIQVSGTVIWMFNSGIWVESMLNVEAAGPNPLLVLVAKPNLLPPGAPGNQEPDAGIALIGGLNSLAVPVILVSDGRVGIEHETTPNTASTVTYLSIFASHALIMGPEAPVSNPSPPYCATPPRLTLSHPSVLPSGLRYVDAAIDLLYQLRLLPNTDAGLNAKLTPIAGTWGEIPVTGMQN